MSESFYFPADQDTSTGGFVARLEFNRWSKNTDSTPSNQDLFQDVTFTVWLPMPEQLNFSYTAQFEDADDFHHNNRANIDANMDLWGFGTSGAGRGSGSLSGIAKELISGYDSLTTLNNSARMNQGAVANNNLGVVFKGANLRNHTFSWTLTPKDSDEQKSIEDIVFHIKQAAMPGKTDFFGKDGSVKSREAQVRVAERDLADHKKTYGKMNKAAGLTKARVLAEAAKALSDAKKSATNEDTAYNTDGSGDWQNESLTTLTIPYTVNMRFYQLVGGKYVENHHLPNIGDCFMTDVTVGYSTQAGGYSAYDDGAPLNTKLGLNLKEILPMTQQSIKKGY